MIWGWDDVYVMSFIGQQRTPHRGCFYCSPHCYSTVEWCTVFDVMDGITDWADVRENQSIICCAGKWSMVLYSWEEHHSTALFNQSWLYRCHDNRTVLYHSNRVFFYNVKPHIITLGIFLLEYPEIGIYVVIYKPCNCHQMFF